MHGEFHDSTSMLLFGDVPPAGKCVVNKSMDDVTTRRKPVPSEVGASLVSLTGESLYVNCHPSTHPHTDDVSETASLSVARTFSFTFLNKCFC